MSADSFNDNKKLLSDFNEGSFQILRLHNLWDECNRLCVKADYARWRFNLDRIWIELFADAEKTKGKYYIDQIQKLNKLINLSYKDKDRLYLSLLRKEQFLKKLQDDVGKGSRRSNQFEDMMV